MLSGTTKSGNCFVSDVSAAEVFVMWVPTRATLRPLPKEGEASCDAFRGCGRNASCDACFLVFREAYRAAAVLELYGEMSVAV